MEPILIATIATALLGAAAVLQAARPARAPAKVAAKSRKR